MCPGLVETGDVCVNTMESIAILANHKRTAILAEKGRVEMSKSLVRSTMFV